MLKKSILIIFLVLLIDQVVKIWVKTHLGFRDSDAIHVFGSNWFIIQFTENKGMAFGMEFGSNYGKLILSLFRIFAISAIGWYLYKLIKENASKLYIVCMSLIFAGAIGNIIDSAFYGLIFNETYPDVAQLFPTKGGYATFLHGRVVDMIHIVIKKPAWLPWFWDKEIFPMIFNIADSSISIGVMMLIVFQKRFFKKQETAEIQENITV